MKTKISTKWWNIIISVIPMFLIPFLFSVLILSCDDEVEVTFLVEAKGGGGYYTDTSLKFEAAGEIIAISGKGLTDADDNEIRIGISTTDSNWFDIQASNWIEVPSSNYNKGSFYARLNSKWGSDKDSEMSLKVTVKGTDPDLTYSEVDTYTDDLDYVHITKQ